MAFQVSNRAASVGLAVTFFLCSIIPAAGQDPSLVANGQKLYSEKRCAVCHIINGQGGKAGPELTHTGAQHDPEWLAQFLKAPKSVNPKARMPAFRGSEEELNAVVAYMASLK